MGTCLNEWIIMQSERKTNTLLDYRCGKGRFYFFNPFSIEILQKVLCRILESYYAEPRERIIIFKISAEEEELSVKYY